MVDFLEGVFHMLQVNCLDDGRKFNTKHLATRHAKKGYVLSVPKKNNHLPHRDWKQGGLAWLHMVYE